jgi:hypothetical protein
MRTLLHSRVENATVTHVEGQTLDHRVRIVSLDAQNRVIAAV